METITPFLIIIFIYLFLIAPRMFHKADARPFLNIHYAHRGLFDNHSAAPENSIPAFQKAVNAGYGIELDVQLTKDNIPVVFHDASLKRMCGVDGRIWEFTFQELQNFSLAGSNAKIPTLEAALHTINGKVPIIVEYKLDKLQTKVCVLGNELLSRYNGPYCIECFHPLALIWYRIHQPKVMRGQLSMNFWTDAKHRKNPLHVLQSFLITNFLTRPDFIAFNHSHAANPSRCICKWLGAISVAWTIKSHEEYEKSKKHFDLFIFDSFEL